MLDKTALLLSESNLPGEPIHTNKPKHAIHTHKQRLYYACVEHKHGPPCIKDVFMQSSDMYIVYVTDRAKR